MPVTTSTAYKQAVVQNNRTWRAAIKIYLNTGNTLVLSENDITLGTLIFEEASTCSDSVSVGSTYANTLSFSLQNPGNMFADVDLADARLTAEIGLEIGKNPNGSSIWEDIPLGEFFILEVGKKMATIPIKCFDRMVKLNGPLSGLGLNNMETPSTIMSKIRQKYGYSVGAETQLLISNLDTLLGTAALSDEMTCRDFVGYCAAFNGVNARFDREGKLEFFKNKSVPANMENTVITTPETRLSDLSYSERPVKITGVIISDAEGKTYKDVDKDDYLFVVDENPIIINESLAGESLRMVSPNLKFFTYKAYTTGIIGDPSIQAGDPVCHEHLHNSAKASDYINSIITNHQFKFRGNSSLEGKGGMNEQNKQLTASAKKLSEIEQKAKEEINDAKEAGREALIAGQNALQAAQKAEEDARDATAKANEAFENAAGAKNIANTALQSVDTAVSNASGALESAKEALNSVNGLQGTIETEFKKIDGQLSSKASQSEVNSLSGTVSNHTTQITQNTTAIQSKANQTDVNTLTGRVSTAESTITQQAGQISSKASQTDVNTLTGRVTAAESEIIQQANSFSLSLAQQSKAVNDLAGVSVLQAPWQQGNLSTSTGAESASTSYVRSDFFDVKAGSKYLLQTFEGASAYSAYSTAYLFYYRENKTFLSYTTLGSSTSPFTAPANARYLRVRFTTKVAPGDISCYLLPTETANGYVDLTKLTSMTKIQATADSLLLSVSETQESIGAPFKIRKWEQGTLNLSTGAESASTAYLRSEFIDVTPGERYISQLINGSSVTMYYFYYTAESTFVSYTSSSTAITIPSGVGKMRARVTTSIKPEVYTGNVFAATARQDYTKVPTVYSAMLMQNDTINLRVSKNDVINQINISNESILISGNKIHITGTTTIDSGIIKNAMIASAAITSAKIADLAVTSAKISSLDASKITTGTLSAARIGANSISADKVTSNFLQALTGSSSIRITGTTISYYSGSALTSQINSNGFELTQDNVKIGRVGTNNFVGQSTWRGLVFDLENAGRYMTWAWRESSTASHYTTKFTYFRSKLENGKEKGFHFDDVVYIKDGIAAANGSGLTVTNNWKYINFDTSPYLTRTTTNEKAGVALGGSTLLLGSQDKWTNFKTIIDICQKFAGKTIYLPASSSGLSTWWPITFPSMTTWS